ncbi:MAG: glycosyltransferase [Candidatus Taylorbacteria bacterium]|nr:glycosyltransferase [Candidatus Taylorbacteria bacterium]
MNNLSVIIITRNRLEKLKRCVDSVNKVLLGSELVVVDNGSNDGTVDYLNRWESQKDISAVLLQANKGVAVARNIGLRKAFCPFIVFIDDDAWIEEIDFNGIKGYFNDNPLVGIIAPRILYVDGRIQESIRSFPTLLSILWRGTFLHKIFPNASWYRGYISHEMESIHETDWAIGACQIIRREVFERIGPYDEKYFFGYEDADLCRRASRCGYSTMYWPHARIYHEYARESSKGLNMHLLRHIKSIIRFMLK